MPIVRLATPGKGNLHIQGSPAARRWIVLLARDNFREDDPLLDRLAAHFVAQGRTVVRYESRTTETRRLIHPAGSESLPRPWRRLLAGLRLAVRPSRWIHALPAHRRKISGIPFRVRALRALLTSLGADRDFVLVTRSASGRVASLVADQTPTAGVVCLAYPFQHPREGPDPTRYAHLATLRTPTLILQGVRDRYGGREIEGRHDLAPAVRLEWVDTDHEFRLDEPAWARVLARLDAFLATLPEPAARP